MDGQQATNAGHAVLAVIVVYHPDAARLQVVLEAAREQCARVCVVINGADSATLEWLQGREEAGLVHRLITAPRNQGLGWAHNQGVAEARAAGMSHVLLLDQDSVLDPHGVARLLEAERELLDSGIRPGAVAAEFRDSRTGVRYSFLQWTGWRFRKVRHRERSLLPVDHAISSGSLIPLAVLDAVGDLREDFFIDYVDVEWCHRARHGGYPVFGLTVPLVDHQLGRGVRRLPFGVAMLPLHPAWRVYYIFRNALLLYRAPHVSRRWALQHFRRLCAKGCAILALCPGRRRYARAIAGGLVDGLRGRAGATPAFMPEKRVLPVGDLVHTATQPKSPDLLNPRVNGHGGHVNAAEGERLPATVHAVQPEKAGVDQVGGRHQSS